MTSYDSFAIIYDDVMGARQNNIDRVLSLIKKYRPESKSILELGSGTGSVLKGLAPFFEISGIELSANMLEIARQKVPTAHLYLGDMVTLPLEQTFDVVICMYDTINHLKEYEKWEQFFERCAKNLNPEGLFIFDINTLGRLQRLAADPGFTQEHGDVTMDLKVTRISDHEVMWNIELIKKELSGVNHHASETIFEASFPIDQITGSLKKYFGIKEIVSKIDNEEPSDEVDKVFFVCQKI